MSGKVLDKWQAAKFVGLPTEEFVKVVQHRSMPRPRLLEDDKAYWLSDDLEDALTALPYSDGSRADFKPSRRVYFVGAKPADLIKVGIANHVETRVRDLEMGSPVRLYIYASVKGTHLDEGAFHIALREHRERGEWFRRGPWFDVVRNGVLAGETAKAILQKLEPRLA